MKREVTESTSYRLANSCHEKEVRRMVCGDIEPLQLTGNQLVPLMMTISRCELSRYNELCSRYAELECLWLSRGR